MRVQIIAVSLLILSSCRHENKQDVFLGFQLGASRAETDVKYQQLYNSGVLKKYQEDGDAAYYYQSKIPASQKNYYAMMLFNGAVGDTIITSIDLVFLDNLNHSLSVLDGTRNGRVYMNLNKTPDNENEPSSDQILVDVLKDLTSKYGKYDSKDSHTGAMGDRTTEEYKWKDRKNVDITLTYTINTAHNSELQNSGFNTDGASSLVLEYNYNEEAKKKLAKGTSVY